MAANSETVYIKADRNVEVTKAEVTLGDVVTMECANPSVVPKLNTIKLLKFHHTDKKHQNRTTVSILKVIECIHQQFPNMDVRTWEKRTLSLPMRSSRLPEAPCT